MVRIILATIMLLTLNSAMAQSINEKKSELYAQRFAEKFGMSKKTQQEFYEVKLESMNVNSDFAKRNKGGEFDSDDAYKTAKKEALAPLNDKMIEIAGIKANQFWSYNKEIMPEINAVKK